MKKQVHVYYSGKVQGVGFRFTAENIAIKFGVTGWVKNLPDGRVEIIAQQEENILNEFLGKIQEYFSRYIRNADIKWSEVESKFQEFNIEF